MSTFGYWRQRLLWSTYTGYAVFYMLRKNLSMAQPVLKDTLGLDKSTFGIFFTLHDLSYGFAKLAAGMAADRFNPRVLLVIGMLASALCNLLFGFVSGTMLLGIIWILNGWAQGFGFPPCARILSFWFAPHERGRFWGIFNTSHQVGTIAISLLVGYLLSHYDWRWAFWVPAALGVLTSAMLWERVRDTPASLGLESVEEYHSSRQVGLSPETPPEIGPATKMVQEEDTSAFISRMVWRNPVMWTVCIGNFFVYVVRTSFLNWAPAYLSEVKHVSIMAAGSLTSIYELAGLFGCLTSGWVTDRLMGGRRAPACFLWMLLSTLFIFLFWRSTSDDPRVYGFYLAGVGFAVYGPQFLVGVMVADLATKRAAGTAVGLSGLLGYLSSVFSGFAFGGIAQKYGWNAAFGLVLISSVLACVPFVLTWNAKAPEE
jgi:sugar phosphate permease